jgi:hypothetical protein
MLNAQTILIDAKAGIGGTIAPTYLDWSEVLRNRRSPDILQTLDLSTTALYRVSEKFFFGGDFLYKQSSEQLDARIGFGAPAELSATWLIPSVASCLRADSTDERRRTRETDFRRGLALRLNS